MTIRIGVICPSDIAFRRFMPAVTRCQEFEYIGVACADEQEWFGNIESERDLSVLKHEQEKADRFVQAYGGKRFDGYRRLLQSTEIDAVYLPLPPALHFQWARQVIQNGKHLLLEKPSTTSESDTRVLIEMAREANVALHENYMFVYHRQIQQVEDVIAQGTLGDLRLIRISFGFPFRGAQDFRYSKVLGGGALLDCGGYTIKLAQILLGSTARIIDSRLFQDSRCDVDLFGNAVMRNDVGLTAHIAFGMDNSYQCQLEVWGSKGYLTADRIFTPPADYSPHIRIQLGQEQLDLPVEPDDQFYHSLHAFSNCIQSSECRERKMDEILRQSMLVEVIKNAREAECGL